MGEKFNTRTEQLEQAKRNLGEKGTGVYLKILRDAARDLDMYSEMLKPANDEFRVNVLSMAEAATNMARTKGVSGEEDREQLRSDIKGILTAEQAMSETYVNVTEFAENLVQWPHMERTLTRSARRAAELINEAAEITELAQSEFGRARHVLEQRLAGSLDLN